ncbi:hypothetical protein HYH03_001657 [Edaphochlamys debaryana]|uniref:Uncharacterized protein n=1 Tax=Edaphochlamys debaryana TaxID=47281 RepID=A0A835YDV5_9CHLO|nr:hypothetical protein HYH03_001657 [Edaphochlamys debaryana]|eukprot:KAG2500898.1 hypothetical protein HYH03_001657 [Edaphochlamys debaryana]
MFALDALRISRIFNPRTPIYLLCDKEVMENNTWYRHQLDHIGIKIEHRSSFRSNTSRAVKYERLQEGAHLEHVVEMQSRFCEVADFASARSLRRLLVTDADVALFADARAVLGLHGEDVVAPSARSSQLALWSIEALDSFCDALMALMRMRKAERTELFERYNLTGGRYNDMDALSMFIQEQGAPWAAPALGLSTAVLVSEAPAPRNPWPVLWTAAEYAQGIPADPLHPPPLPVPTGEWHNKDCKYWDELVTFSPVPWSTPVPVPVLRGVNLPLPFVHFNKACKWRLLPLFVWHYLEWHLRGAQVLPGGAVWPDEEEQEEQAGD